MALDPNTVYKATLTLSSVGEDNRFLPNLTFDPDLTYEGDEGDIPESYRLAGYLLQHLMEQSSFDLGDDDGEEGDDEYSDDEMPDVTDTHEYNETASNVVPLRKDT